LSEEAAVVTKKIICLNGPPGSGKDTGAFAILGFCARHAAWMQGTHEKFAEPLKAGVHKLFGMFEGWNRFDNPTHAHLKDEVHRDLFGMTPREAYIWMSEKCVKPLLGEDAFGQMMEHNLRRKVLLLNWSLLSAMLGLRMFSYLSCMHQERTSAETAGATSVTWYEVFSQM
jgi:hypothetical protein